MGFLDDDDASRVSSSAHVINSRPAPLPFKSAVLRKAATECCWFARCISHIN
jgi:hypothetical protein